MTDPTLPRVFVKSTGRWEYQKICANPDCPVRTFTSFRRDTKYHHVNCRMAASRRRRAENHPNST